MIWLSVLKISKFNGLEGTDEGIKESIYSSLEPIIL